MISLHFYIEDVFFSLIAHLLGKLNLIMTHVFFFQWEEI